MNDRRINELDEYVLSGIDQAYNASSDKSKTFEDRIYWDGVANALGWVSERMLQLFHRELNERERDGRN